MRFKALDVEPSSRRLRTRQVALVDSGREKIALAKRYLIQSGICRTDDQSDGKQLGLRVCRSDNPTTLNNSLPLNNPLLVYH